jgi:hypothetical protein
MRLKLKDDLFGVFDNNEKFILSIPFDKYKPSENKDLKLFSDLFRNEEVEMIKNKKIEFEEFGILFNEK